MSKKGRKGKHNSYAAYFADFCILDENKSLTFSQKTKTASANWRLMSTEEKSTYKLENNPVKQGYDFRGKSEFQLVCPDCGRTFTARYRLKFHSKSCGQKFTCKECNKEFATPTTLQCHIRFVHNKERIFFCPTCDKGFTCRSDLQRHNNTHEEVRFTCGICNMSFSYRSNLLRHCNKIHAKRDDRIPVDEIEK